MTGKRTGLAAPSDLGVTGARLWRDLTAPPAGERLEFSAGETVILTAACKSADTIALLEASLAVDGPVVSGSKGQPKLSGVVAELRLQRAALARLVQALAITDDGAELTTPAQRRAQKAAQKRWSATARREASKHHA